MKHDTRHYTVLLIGVLLALMVLAGRGMTAKAAYPGQNGKIIFSRPGGGFITVDANGENETELAAEGSNPVWSPDGTRIAYEKWRWTGSTSTTDIVVVDADGRNPVQLTNTDVMDYNPSWSPDGRKIAFQTWDPDLGSRIWVMNADGTKKTALTGYENDRSPAWSPDGKKFVFESLRSGTGELYVMDADGSNIERLTYNYRSESSPAWSPDGTRIVFAGVWDDNWEIGVMKADGSGEVRLTHNLDSYDYAPAWSPDGSKIVFEHDADIFIMNTDGTAQTQMTHSTVVDREPNWQPIATITAYSPTNDSYVSQAEPKKVFGMQKVLQVKDAAKDVNSYVKFNVMGLSGEVKLAVLRLYVINPGPDGGRVHAVSPFYLNTSEFWLETALKWNNAPAIAGTALDAVGNAAKGQWVTLDVTAAVVAALGDNGRVSLAITNDSGNLVTYSSKEGAHPPELVVITN